MSNNYKTNSKFKDFVSYIANNKITSLYLAVICLFGFASPVYADWFQVQNVKAALIKPVFDMINDSLGYIAFAAGAGSTFLAKGMDGWQKAVAFGAGALGTAGAVKLAQTVLHLG